MPSCFCLLFPPPLPHHHHRLEERSGNPSCHANQLALKIVGEALYAEPNDVVTDKGDPDWDAEIARIVKELREDGTLGRISMKWFDSDLTQDAS